MLCNERGVNSFKAFLAYKGAIMLESDELYQMMRRCKQLGALALVHAEDGNLVYMARTLKLILHLSFCSNAMQCT